MKKKLFAYISVLFLCVQSISALDSTSLIITEVMANPVGQIAFPETEYIEIQNVSDADILLKDWVFVYDGKDTELPDSVIKAGQFAVLFRGGRDIYADSGGIAVAVGTFPSALANTGKTIGLKNPDGEVVDDIAYPTTKAAQSHERAADGSWYLSKDPRGGTPGSKNSEETTLPPDPDPIDNSQPGDVIINEIMANPMGLTQLPETEYVEFFNTSDSDIYLKNWIFVYDGAEILLPDTVLKSGQYAVLYRSGRIIIADGAALLLPLDKFPSALANTSKTVAFKNSKGIVIDEVTYPNATAAKSYERLPDGTWHNSTDLRGGTPGSKNSEETTLPPDPDPTDNSHPGDVIINEIMANPTGLTQLPETEYVEFFNASDSDIYLKNWSFVYDGTEILLPDTVLKSGEYAVLYRSGRNIVAENSALLLPLDKFPSALANTSKTVALKNSKGTVIDEVTYPAATAAKSYERLPDGTWHNSTDPRGGTPGGTNSEETTLPPDPDPIDNSQPGDVIINEIMANPTGLTQLPETEYIEFFNASDSDFHLKNWVFVYDGNEILLPDTVLKSGQYAVLYRSGRNITADGAALLLPLDKFPSALANTSKTVALKNSKGIVIDEVTYPPATATKSYERLPDGAWHNSTDPRGGTPGSKNSEETALPPDPDPIDNSQPGDVIINEIMANPTGLTQLPETEYVEFYNVSDSDIYLKNWIFVYDGTEILLPDTVLKSGQYAVIYRSGRNIVAENSALLLPLDKFPSALANTSKTVALKNSKGTVIDEVTYPPATAAKSYERLPDGTWHNSTDPLGGTPGSKNSEETTLPPDPDPIDNSQPGDLIINEIMANPVGLTQLPETEYVEFYNASNSDIYLKNWIFVYDGTEISLPDTVLKSGQYAVLYRSGRNITAENSALLLPLDKFPSALANTSKTVALKNSKGVVIDDVTYPAATAAKSYERLPDGTWHNSTDPRGGTPGGKNSEETVLPPNPDPTDNSQPGDVIINEIMANPTGLSQLPETEYVEFYNASDSDIYLKNWTFVYDGSETELPDTVLKPGQFAVIYRSGRNITAESSALLLPLDKFPSALANTSKTVALKNSKGVVIDEVTYPAATAAKSYERLPDGTWHNSTDPRGGTPGSKNSEETTVPPNPDPIDNSQPGDVIINEIMANPTGLTQLSETEYIEFYNASGSDIYLKNWSFVYDGTEILLSDTVLKSGQYAVIYRSGRNIVAESSALLLPLDKFPSALANTSKTVALKNSKGVVIDEVTYPNATAAKSYERLPDGTWHNSTDPRGGTPGSKNSEEIILPPDPDPTDNSQPGDVIINEIMANPTGLTQLPETEYVEFYNASDSDIYLKNWIFVYDSTEILLSDTILKSGQYAVIYRSGRNIVAESSALLLPLDKFPSALANTSKTVSLKNSKGTVIDEVTYPNATAAKSYERLPDGMWHNSTDPRGGTPGSKNSGGTTVPPDPDPIDDSQPGDVIINEIMANPTGLTQLSETEYVEFYNASGSDIYLKNWTFVYDGSETELPDTVLKPGQYAVIYRSGRNITAESSALLLPLDKFPSALANTSKTVALRNSKGTVIDEVTYPNATAAKSYERLPDGAWHNSTDPRGGTPGGKNSEETTLPPDPDPTDNSQPGDVIINEIMANPVGLTQLPETEYVEFFNASGSDIYLKNWAFVYDGTEISLPDTVLKSGQYALIYRSGRNIVAENSALLLPLDKFPSALANTGRTVALKNSKGLVIDEVTYPPATAAKSYERLPDGAWHNSTDPRGGTPGGKNSEETAEPPTPGETSFVEPLEIIINEILANPYTGGSEYIELYNRSDKPLSVSGLAIALRDAEGNLRTHYPLKSISATIEAGGYIVLTENKEGVLNFYPSVSSESVYVVNLPILNNEGSDIVLFRTGDNVVIDEVHYSSDWHNGAIKEQKGVSLERIHSDGDSNDKNNWISAIFEAGYGTPGYKNSQDGAETVAGKLSIEAPEYMDGFDYYLLKYQTDKTGYHCRAEVYSTSGKKVAEITNNQLVALESELKWDGKGLDGNRLIKGVYVFYAELFNPQTGEHKAFKRAFLVK